MVWRYSSSAAVAASCDTAPHAIPPTQAAREAPAGPFRQGTARGRGLAIRAEVGRLPDDRLPRRRRGAPPEPQREADEPLLPRGDPPHPGAAGEEARARRRARDRGEGHPGI